MSSLDYDKTDSILGSEVVDNDVDVKLQELTSQLLLVQTEKQTLEKEKQEMHDSYNEQRAKFQKLYIQKEEEVKRLKYELDDAQTKCSVRVDDGQVKEEKLKAQAEQIAELSQIVQDTVEESSSSQNQVKNLQLAIHSLEDKLAKLTSDRGDSLLLAPSNMLSATKSIAKKLVSQLGPDLDRSADDLEDSMKKAKEDAEVIRSLVVPLEKKIDELQEKLRLTEEKLRKHEEVHGRQKNLVDVSARSSLDSLGLDGADGVSPSRSFACDMCANYEAQLQAQQQLTKRLQKQKQIIEMNMDKFKEDLAKETQFRKEMEEKWGEKKEEQKLQVAQLKAEVVAGKSEVQELVQAFESMCSDVREEINRLSFSREKVDAEMRALQKENESLVGKHSKHSAELHNEAINFPDNVEDLQVLLLRLHEDLIAAMVAKEAKEEQEETLKCEVQLLQSQLLREQNQRTAMEENLTAENSALRHQVEMLGQERRKLKTDVEKLMMEEIRYKAELETQATNLKHVSQENKKNSDLVAELRTCVSSLQEQLDRSEEVQKDFVRLSQSLQIELEKIRGADTEVRWQHEDDVSDCQGCKQAFVSAKKKAHCKHCGKIFCPACLHHSVLSGPNQRPSRVCQVCHTLLNQDTAPYFSQEPPHSPD